LTLGDAAGPEVVEGAVDGSGDQVVEPVGDPVVAPLEGPDAPVPAGGVGSAPGLETAADEHPVIDSASTSRPSARRTA
jgi:hypothetical protein